MEHPNYFFDYGGFKRMDGDSKILKDLKVIHGRGKGQVGRISKNVCNDTNLSLRNPEARPDILDHSLIPKILEDIHNVYNWCSHH